jgi:hypothetical protein
LQQIDEAQLDSDLAYRFGYLTEFMGFGEDDIAAIHGSAAHLAPLVTKPYDGSMLNYLDVVGKIHTPKAGSAELDVPLVQMNALMGFVSDALVATILGLGLDADTQTRTLRAFNRLLWLQNDLITRHYQAA